MRVLVVRHVLCEHLGLIAPALASAGIEFLHADLFAGYSPRIDPAGFDGLISLGGLLSANDDLPYIREELGILERAVARGIPVLGVCLGAQLLARALGAPVRRNAVKEIGWFPIEFTPPAATDALFGGIAGPETVFHWHGETFDLPAGAVLLASSRYCANQAFRAGANVYGLQFHLEVTPAMIAGWCAEEANCGDVRELAAPLDPHCNARRLAELAALVFGRWAACLSPRVG